MYYSMSEMFTRACRSHNEPFHIFTHDAMPTRDAHRLPDSTSTKFARHSEFLPKGIEGKIT